VECLEDRTVPSTFTVTNTLDDGSPGSLRWAMYQVEGDSTNTAANPDIIAFNITAASDAAAGGTGFNATTGVATIQPTSALPVIDGPVVINGYTQPGASPNNLTVGDNAVIKIDLNGSLAGPVSGLYLKGANSTVEGLAVTNFSSGAGILVVGGNSTIAGNFIGTDVTGTVAEGNETGIGGGATGDVFGGTNPAQRNVISGNGVGINVSANGVQIEGNYIGTDTTGTQKLGNNEGIDFYSGFGNATIGGPTQTPGTGPGNVISGNAGDGISLAGSSGNVVQGDLIGTDSSGTQPLGNQVGIRGGPGSSNNTIEGNVIAASVGNAGAGVGSGIALIQYGPPAESGDVIEGNYIGTNAAGATNLGNGASGVYVEGYVTGTTIESNTLAYNGLYGIGVNGASGISFLGNSFVDNLNRDIGLSSGANNNQASPVLTSATTSSTGTVITGTLSAYGNSTFRIDFFSNGSGLPGEQRFIDFAKVTTDAQGNFTANLSEVIRPGTLLAATATDANGNTSDLWGQVTVKAAPTVSVSDAGGTYNGSPFPASGTAVGVDGKTPVAGSFSYAYYVGSGTSGTSLGSTALTNAGTYTVVATFTSTDADYGNGTAQTTFTINKATPSFSQLSAPNVVVGTAQATISGKLSAGTVIPSGSVSVQVGSGTAVTATLNPDGTFSASVPVSSLAVGAYPVTLSYAGDSNFNSASGSATLDVAYGIKVLTNLSQPIQAGSTQPIQLELDNAAGQNITAANITVTGVSLVSTTTGQTWQASSPGNSNPTNTFSFKGSGADQYNLQLPTDLTTGNYLFNFTIQGDPVTHSLAFSVK
jgi:hypothetical protein